MKTDINGISQCPKGQEQYEEFYVRRSLYIQYEYRTKFGRLFTCIAPTVEIARLKRDKWELGE